MISKCHTSTGVADTISTLAEGREFLVGIGRESMRQWGSLRRAMPPCGQQSKMAEILVLWIIFKINVISYLKFAHICIVNIFEIFCFCFVFWFLLFCFVLILCVCLFFPFFFTPSSPRPYSSGEQITNYYHFYILFHSHQTNSEFRKVISLHYSVIPVTSSSVLIIHHCKDEISSHKCPNKYSKCN